MLTRSRSARSLRATAIDSASIFSLDSPALTDETESTAGSLLSINPSRRSSSVSSLTQSQSHTSPPPFSSLKPLRRSSSSNVIQRSDNQPKKALKSASVKTHARHRPKRDDKIEELRHRALAIPPQGKASVNPQQLAVLETVYYEVTPYPDAVWISLLSLIINRHYHTVKNWFSNQRQQVKAENRENEAYDLPRMVEQFMGPEGRPLKLRPVALGMAKEVEWTDDFFEGIVMVYNMMPRVPMHGKAHA